MKPSFDTELATGLLARIDALQSENKLLNANLTTTQTRCTELLLETRNLKAELLRARESARICDERANVAWAEVDRMRRERV